MASQNTGTKVLPHIPLEIARMICQEMVPVSERDQALSTDTKQDLKQVRLLAQAFGTAGAEHLFRRVVCTNEELERVSNERIAKSPSLGRNVKEIEFRLNLNQQSNAPPQRTLEYRTRFRKWLIHIKSILSVFKATETLMIVGYSNPANFVPHYATWVSQWSTAIGILIKSLPRLRNLLYSGHKGAGAWIVGVTQTVIQDQLTSLLLQYSHHIEERSDDELKLRKNLSVLERLTIKGYDHDDRFWIFWEESNLELPALRVLELMGIRWDASDDLSKLLATTQKLEVFKIWRCAVPFDVPRECSRVLRALGAITTLKTLLMDWSFDCDETAMDWSEPFRCSLEELILNEATVSSQMILHLLSGGLEKLRHFHLDTVTLSDQRFAIVMNALKSCDSLMQLCMQQNREGSEGLSRELVEVTEASQLVVDVDPSLNDFDEEDVTETYPSIRDDWRRTRFVIDYSGEGESIFRLGELLREVLARGGNRHKCRQHSSHLMFQMGEDFPQHIAPIFEQEALASLPPWAAIRNGQAQRTDVYAWGRETGGPLETESEDI